MGTAGKTLPEEHVRWMEAAAAAVVRGEDVIDCNRVCLGKGVYAVEPCDG